MAKLNLGHQKVEPVPFRLPLERKNYRQFQTEVIFFLEIFEFRFHGVYQKSVGLR